jgi:anaerobic ribonucleoside-triphosphate reductase activating protein
MTGLALNRIHYPVTALGPGVRVGIWVQGCSIGCRGCVSQDTWAAENAPSTPTAGIVELIRTLVAQGVDGITITGGEPFDQPEGLLQLLDATHELREHAPRPVDVLCYSGRPLHILQRRFPEILACVDAVISEPYLAGRPTRLIWRGSSNQRLTPLTPLGEERYGPYLQHAPERRTVQVAVDEQVWLIGIPDVRDLDRLAVDLQIAGVTLGEVSWRS